MNKTWKCVQTSELITLLCPWKALILSDERAHGVLNTVQSLARLHAAFGLKLQHLEITALLPQAPRMCLERDYVASTVWVLTLTGVKCCCRRLNTV